MKINKRVYTANSISELDWKIKHTEPTECLDKTLEDCFVYIPKNSITDTLKHILDCCGVTNDSDVGKMFNESLNQIKKTTKTFSQVELNTYNSIINNLEHMSHSDMVDIIKKLILLLLMTGLNND